MKKTLPAIVILISLSLLGLILLQASWLKNLLTVRTEQVYTKARRAVYNVSVDLYKSNAPIKKLPKGFGFKRFGDMSVGLFRPPSVDQRFSQKDIYNKLRSSFNREDLQHLNFEFGIASTTGELEMLSSGFEKECADTINNKSIYLPIAPEDANELEQIGPFETIIVVTPDFKKQVWDSLRWILVGAAVFMIIIIAAFYITLKTLFNQKKLSEIKSDFINNMTHEFKTPLATISLAVDAVRNEKVQNDKQKLDYFSGIIKEENKRMNKHVETILQAALMEKQELQLNLRTLHVHDIIHKVVDNYQLQLHDKGGNVELLLNAKYDVVNGDEVHFTNLISNLVDNAIKYSKENLLIKITTHSTGKHLIVAIEDNGIGMSKESVKRIFEKFYRAHTGNVHNVKGFGLGMSYVRTVIDAHKGKIKVDSALGKGSTFAMEFPLGATKA